MHRVDVRPVRRAPRRRTASLLAMSLAAGLAAAVAVTPGWATATPTVTRVLAAATASADPATDPVEETPTVDPTATEPDPPTAPPTESAPPETTPPAPDPTTTSAAPPTSDAGNPAPTTTAPTATTAPPPQQGPPPVVSPAAPGPGQPAPSRLGVRVTTGDVTLTDAYWTAASTVTKLRVTIANTGSAPERVRLAYTLPAGLTDAGTEGCASSGGGNYRCGEWTTTPGDRFSTSVRVRVAGTAWRQMPLSGSVRVTATGPGVTGSAQDNEGFAVLFPAGPPVPGIRLQADEVAFDISGGPSQLDVRLGNSGKVDAAGRVEVILPAGVSVPTPPPGCLPVASSRTRCEVGAVPAGRVATLRLPVTATPEAQRAAPLAGAIVGRLDPRSGKTRQLQMSFRITAAAALSTPVAVTPAPTASQGVLAGAGQRDGDGGLSSIQHTAIILMAVSGLLVVLALALATTSLRRRMTGPVADPRTAPAGSE
jgi:hypothetical protein